MTSLKQWAKKKLEGTRLLRWYYLLYPQKPLYVESLWQALALSRWVMYARVRARMFLLLLRSSFKVRMLPEGERAEGGPAHLTKVIGHNFWKDFSSAFSRRRSEHLIYLLRCVPSVGPESRVLSIGPKNEGEVLLLKAHGFRRAEAIDLFSYSPLIRVMDMHKMDYPDGTFDAVCAGWVVRYSYDIACCAREMARVVKDGGVIAIGFSGHPAETNVTTGLGASLHGGIEELLGHFAPHVDHVYWRLEDGNTDESKVPEHTHSVVFRVRKRAP